MGSEMCIRDRIGVRVPEMRRVIGRDATHIDSNHRSGLEWNDHRGTGVEYPNHLERVPAKRVQPDIAMAERPRS